MSRAPQVTDHAVNRYRARYVPAGSGLTFEDLRDTLQEIADRSTKTREKTRDGAEVWDGNGVRFVVRRDAGNKLAAITVLPKLETTFEETDDHGT